MKYDINANGPIGESNAKGDGEVGRLMSIVTATLGALGIDYIGSLLVNFGFWPTLQDQIMSDHLMEWLLTIVEV